MSTETLIAVTSLTKHFKGRGGKAQIHALDGVDLDIYRGKTVVIIGPPARASPPSCAVSICWRFRPAAPSR